MATETGFGVVLQRNSVAIAEIKELGGISLSRDAIEKTHHGSPDAWREFLKGLKDGGEVSMVINYDPAAATHNATTGLLADFADDTTIDDYDIVFPDVGTTTWSFPGFITEFEAVPDLEDLLTANVTIKVAGKPTLA